MDFQSLTQLFATTYDSNPNNRKAGELTIRKVRAFGEADLDCQVDVIITHLFISTQLAGQEGVIPALLQIIASDNVDKYVNLLHVFDLVFAINRLLHRCDCAFSFFRHLAVPLARPFPSGSKTALHHLTAPSPRAEDPTTSQSRLPTALP